MSTWARRKERIATDPEFKARVHGHQTASRRRKLKLEQLRAAIRDEGPAPELHRAVMARHRREWPVLWEALDDLLAEDK